MKRVVVLALLLAAVLAAAVLAARRLSAPASAAARPGAAAARPGAAARLAGFQAVSAAPPSSSKASSSVQAGRRVEAFGTYRLPHVRLSADLDHFQAALAAAGEPVKTSDPPPGAARTASAYTGDELRQLALYAVSRVSGAGAGRLDLIEVESATKNLVSGSEVIEYTIVFLVFATDRNEAVKLVADVAFDGAPRLRRARLYSAPSVDAADVEGLSAQSGGRPPPAEDATPWKPALAFDPRRDRIAAAPPAEK